MRKNHFSFILRKRAAAILLLLAISISAGAQTPMFFKYQAIVRDSVGSPMASSNVSMRISILEASITGTPVYSEVHNELTSPGGLITLNIGGGIPEQGNFINIDWGVAEYFVKVEVKPEDSDEFIFMGTSQLMSVPYALYARHAYGPPIYSWQDIQNLPDPGPGMMVYVSDMQTLAYYNDSTWVVLGDCPPVTSADAGADQLNIDGTSAVLQANIPQAGTGMWSIISGTGGAFSDPTDPSTTFTGQPGQIYELAWTITNLCNQTSSDNVFIGFCPVIGIVSAGGDAVDACSPYALQGSEPGTGNTALWQIIAGNGGTLSDAGIPNAELSGVVGETYILTYTVSNACGGESDTVTIIFADGPTQADAGADQPNIDGTSAVLQANIPQAGTGMWSIISGTGGAFIDPSDPSTTFTGEPGQIYELAWTITNLCNQTSSDNVFIGFCPVIGIVSAGGDAVDACSPYALQGSAPGTGNTAQWQILEGSGGSLSDAGNPNAELTGVSGETYILTYTVSNACGGESDTVTINFADDPTQANAGADQLNIDGTSAVMQANIPLVGTGIWSIASGSGGSFSDPTDPLTTFTGQPGQTYELVWTITNQCNQTSSDNVFIGFCGLIGTVYAGNDETNACQPYILQGSDPGTGNNALWEIVSGNGGNLSNPTDPNSEFTGNHGETYTLSYTVSNACDTASDMLTIVFSLYPTLPDAGPDMIGLTDLTVTLQGNQAVTGSGIWTISSGAGGVISNPGDPNSLFTGELNQAYTLVWTISNACYSNSDFVNVSFGTVFACGLDFTDPRDNQVYPTVQIGDQCWMAKNLNVGVQVFTTQSNNGIVEKYCYDHDPVNCEDYGGLYTWNELMNYETAGGAQGICPDGWYVPTVSNFNDLIDYLGGTTVAGGKLKEQGDLYWNNNVGATNESGFSARGAGFHTGLYFNKITEQGLFFSSSMHLSQRNYMGTYNNSNYAVTATQLPSYSLSVRCIKNN